MDKQVYHLIPQDFANHPAWFFPMDETVEDEATVRPVPLSAPLPDGLQVIVSCMFTTADGRVYPGYLYHGEKDGVEYLKPVLWTDTACVTFWNGMHEPDPHYLALVHQNLPMSWPINYESVGIGHWSLKQGELAGLYYMDDGGHVRCVCPSSTTRLPSTK